MQIIRTEISMLAYNLDEDKHIASLQFQDKGGAHLEQILLTRPQSLSTVLQLVPAAVLALSMSI